MSPLIPPNKPAKQRLAELIAELTPGGDLEPVQKELHLAFPNRGASGKQPTDPTLDDKVVKKLLKERVPRIFLASVEIQRTLAITAVGTDLIVSNGVVPDVKVPLFTAAEHQTSADDLPTHMTGHPRSLLELQAQHMAPDLFVMWAAGLGAKPRTAELCDIASLICASVTFAAKYLVSVDRPSVLNNLVVPQLLVPGHSSCPSGHATNAFVLASLLTEITKADPDREKFLNGMAGRVAGNRMSAGLHTKLDTDSGQVLGKGLATMLSRKVATLNTSSLYDTMYGLAIREWL